MRSPISYLSIALFGLVACPGPTEQPPPVQNTGTGWSQLKACKHQQYVYAVGASKAPLHNMSRMSAEMQARRGLLGSAAPEGSKVTLHDSELLDSYSTPEGLYALARSSDAQLDRSALPACDPAAVEWRSPAGACPAWTHRTSWLEGGVAHAVGSAEGIRNPSLALSAATNRARTELTKMSSVEITIHSGGGSGGGSTSSSIDGNPAGPTVVEQVECEGVLYVHVRG